jgi:chromosomal replication initiator protein
MSLEMPVADLWQEALAVVRKKISDQQFQTWFRGLEAEELREDGSLSLKAPNRFYSDWVSKKYGNLLDQAVQSVSEGRCQRVHFSTQEGGETFLPMPELETAPPRTSKETSRGESLLALNGQFTLSTFIVGPSNRMAAAAAEVLCSKDHSDYNPLFFYGPVGVGKTHLLQAICAASRERNPRMKIRFLTGEQFTNEFIAAIEGGSLDAFRTKYREADLLVVDDFHFIAGKEKSQEEFLHTFNAVRERGRQVILAAPSAPPELSSIQERLKSRISSGMVCGMELPEAETRRAIVNKRLKALDFQLPEDVIRLLVDHIGGAARELEGAVTRLVGHATLLNTSMTAENARGILRDLLATRGRMITIDDISEAVGGYFSVKRMDLVGPRRSHAITLPRQICMYLARQLTSHSLEEIGRFFGNRDHSTVLYGVEKIATRCAKEGTFRELVQRLHEESRQDGLN